MVNSRSLIFKSKSTQRIIEKKARIVDKETLREYLLKETELVQGIISRMANNSFLIKGWSVTLVVASLLFKGVFYHHFVALIPWLIFWCYDAYFLRLEKLYRKSYDWLINNRLDNDRFLLDMAKDSLEERFGKEVPCLSQIAFSKTLVIFYGILFIIILSAILVDLYTWSLNLSTT